MTECSVVIDAAADTVYRLVADPIRMAEWSPECVRCRWLGDANKAEVGARFRGMSRNGWRRWSTTSTIAEMRHGQLFAWEVTDIGQPVARWEYRLEPVEDGVRLIEVVHDRRGRLLRTVSPLITGSPDRDRRNADTMEHPRGDQVRRRGTGPLNSRASADDRPVQTRCQPGAVPCHG